MQTCLTIFFKHKYLTMPTITPADALIRAADSLTDAIMGLIPTPTCTTDAVDQLMVIFNQQARKANNAATAQRVLREHAQAERVIKEERQTIKAPASETPTSFPASRVFRQEPRQVDVFRQEWEKPQRLPVLNLKNPMTSPHCHKDFHRSSRVNSTTTRPPPAANTQQQRET